MTSALIALGALTVAIPLTFFGLIVYLHRRGS